MFKVIHHPRSHLLELDTVTVILAVLAIGGGKSRHMEMQALFYPDLTLTQC